MYKLGPFPQKFVVVYLNQVIFMKTFTLLEPWPDGVLMIKPATVP